MMLFPNHLSLYHFLSPFSYEAFTYLLTPLLKQPPGYSSTQIKRSVIHVSSTPSFTSSMSSLPCISHSVSQPCVTVSHNCSKNLSLSYFLASMFLVISVMFKFMANFSLDSQPFPASLPSLLTKSTSNTTL